MGNGCWKPAEEKGEILFSVENAPKLLIKKTNQKRSTTTEDNFSSCSFKGEEEEDQRQIERTKRQKPHKKNTDEPKHK